MDLNTLESAVKHIKSKLPRSGVNCGIILGSGWGDVAAAFEPIASIPYSEIPGLGACGVMGHAGQLSLSELAGIPTLVFQGRRHWYEGLGWTPIALPIYVLKAMGAKAVVLTNASGAIGDDCHPGEAMLISDHINYMGVHPLIGPHHAELGPRFPDMSEIYCRELRSLAKEAALATGVTLREGIYTAFSGPSYESPAEIQMFKKLGASAVGMSTVPEAILANSMGLKVMGIACLANYAAGISKVPLSHDDVAAVIGASLPRISKLVGGIWQTLSLKSSLQLRA